MAVTMAPLGSYYVMQQSDYRLPDTERHNRLRGRQKTLLARSLHKSECLDFFLAPVTLRIGN